MIELDVIKDINMMKVKKHVLKKKKNQIINVQQVKNIKKDMDVFLNVKIMKDTILI